MNIEINLSKNQTTFDEIPDGDLFLQEDSGDFYAFLKVSPSTSRMDGILFNAIHLECGAFVLFEDTEKVIIPSSSSLVINI